MGIPNGSRCTQMSGVSISRSSAEKEETGYFAVIPHCDKPHVCAHDNRITSDEVPGGEMAAVSASAMHLLAIRNTEEHKQERTPLSVRVQMTEPTIAPADVPWM